MDQSYEGQRNKMHLQMKKDRVPYLVTPFFRGIEGDITYRIDDKELRLIPENEASELGFKLAPDAVPEMRNGKSLAVRVKPKTSAVIEQRFPLEGFASAEKMLDDNECSKKVPDKYRW